MAEVVGDDPSDVREHRDECEALAGRKVLEGGASVRAPLPTGSVRLFGPGECFLLELVGEAVLAEPAASQPLVFARGATRLMSTGITAPVMSPEPLAVNVPVSYAALTGVSCCNRAFTLLLVTR